MKPTNILATAAFGLACITGTGHAASYDAVTTFTAPAGAAPFSYGYRTSSPLTFTPFNATAPNCAQITGLTCGYNSGFNLNNLPAVGRNTTGSTITNDPAAPFVTLPTNVLFMHPVNTADAVVRFTAPTSGFYAVSGAFTILDSHATGVVADIRAGAVTQFSTSLFTPTSPGGFSFSIFLAALSTLDFGVNAAGDYSYDSTGLTATISSVPEPASLALLGGGVLAMGFVRRRRA